jgi:tetratricopeptide (TPR) repeat protein
LAENAPDLRAYGLILRGQDLVYRLHKETNLHARRLFEEGGQVDPKYARSYAGMARTYQEEWRYRWSETPEVSIDRALALAERSIELDPSDARGHATLGYARLFRRQHDHALAAYQQARQLNPNDADVLAESGMCTSACGDPQQALQLLQRAMRLNPFYPDWYLWNLGEVHFDLGDYEAAIQTLSRMHDKTQAYRLLTASHALLGQTAEAQHYAAEVLRVQPGFSLELWRTTPPDRSPEIRERYFEGLRKAGLQ